MSRRYRTGPYNNPSRRRGRFLTGVRPLNYGSVARNERSTSYDGHSTGSASFSGRSRDRAGGGRDTRGPEAEVHPQDYLNLVSPDLLSSLVSTLSPLFDNNGVFESVQHPNDRPPYGELVPQWQNHSQFHDVSNVPDQPTFHARAGYYSPDHYTPNIADPRQRDSSPLQGTSAMFRSPLPPHDLHRMPLERRQPHFDSGSQPERLYPTSSRSPPPSSLPSGYRALTPQEACSHSHVPSRQPSPPRRTTGHHSQLVEGGAVAYRHQLRRDTDPSRSEHRHSLLPSYGERDGDRLTQYPPGRPPYSQPREKRRDHSPTHLGPSRASIPSSHPPSQYSAVRHNSPALVPRRREGRPPQESFIDLSDYPSQEELGNPSDSTGINVCDRHPASPSYSVLRPPSYRAASPERKWEKPFLSSPPSQGPVNQAYTSKPPSHSRDRLGESSSLYKEGRIYGSSESLHSRSTHGVEHYPLNSDSRSQTKGELGSPRTGTKPHVHQRSSSYGGEKAYPSSSTSSAGSFKRVSGSVMERLGPKTAPSGFQSEGKLHSVSTSNSPLSQSLSNFASANSTGHSSRGASIESRLGPVPRTRASSAFTPSSERPGGPQKKERSLVGSRSSPSAKLGKGPDLRLELDKRSMSKSASPSPARSSSCAKSPPVYSKKLSPERPRTQSRFAGSHLAPVSSRPPKSPEAKSKSETTLLLKSKHPGTLGSSSRDPRHKPVHAHGVTSDDAQQKESETKYFRPATKVSTARPVSVMNPSLTGPSVGQRNKPPFASMTSKPRERAITPPSTTSRSHMVKKTLAPSKPVTGASTSIKGRPATSSKSTSSNSQQQQQEGGVVVILDDEEDDCRRQVHPSASYSHRSRQVPPGPLGGSQTGKTRFVEPYTDRSQSKTQSTQSEMQTRLPVTFQHRSVPQAEASPNPPHIASRTPLKPSLVERIHPTHSTALSLKAVPAPPQPVPAKTSEHPILPLMEVQVRRPGVLEGPVKTPVVGHVASPQSKEGRVAETLIEGGDEETRQVAGPETRKGAVKPRMDVQVPVRNVQVAGLEEGSMKQLMELHVARSEANEGGIEDMDLDSEYDSDSDGRLVIDTSEILEDNSSCSATETPSHSLEPKKAPVPPSVSQSTLCPPSHSVPSSSHIYTSAVTASAPAISPATVSSKDSTSANPSSQASAEALPSLIGQLPTTNVLATSQAALSSKGSASTSPSSQASGESPPTLEDHLVPVVIKSARGRSKEVDGPALRSRRPQQKELSKDDKSTKIERLAAEVVGDKMARAIAKKLQKQGLKLLYRSISAVHNLCLRLSAHARWSDIKYVDLVRYIGWLFRDYAISSFGQTTSEAGIPSLQKVFTCEVKHLLKVCGSDIELWKMKIMKFEKLRLYDLKVSNITKRDLFNCSVVQGPATVPPQGLAKQPTHSGHQMSFSNPYISPPIVQKNTFESKGSLSPSFPVKPVKAAVVRVESPAGTTVKPGSNGEGGAVMGSDVEPIVITDSSADELELKANTTDIAQSTVIPGHPTSADTTLSHASNPPLPPPSNSVFPPLPPPSPPSRPPPALPPVAAFLENQEAATLSHLTLTSEPFSSSPRPMESSVKALLDIERTLETGIKHLERQVQDEVRELEHAQPLAVESYDYGHKSTADAVLLVNSPQTSDSQILIADLGKEASTGGQPSPPVVSSQKQPIQPASLDSSIKEKSSVQADICSFNAENSKFGHKTVRRSLSPGEIVSPSPPSSPADPFASRNFYFEHKVSTAQRLKDSMAKVKEHAASPSCATAEKALPEVGPDSKTNRRRSPLPSHFQSRSIGGHSEREKSKTGGVSGRTYPRRSRSPPTYGRSLSRRRARSRTRSRSISPAKRHRRRSPSPGARARARRHDYPSHALSSRVHHHRMSSLGQRSRSRSSSPPYHDSKGRRSRRSRSLSPVPWKSWGSHAPTWRRSRSRSPSTRSRSRGQHHSTRSHSRSPEARSRRQKEKAHDRCNTVSGSEEDLELLELRKDALISMIKGDEGVGSQEQGGDGKEVECKSAKGKRKGVEPGQTQSEKVATTVTPAITRTGVEVTEDTPSCSHEGVDRIEANGKVGKVDVPQFSSTLDHSSAKSRVQPTIEPATCFEPTKVCPSVGTVMVEQINLTEPTGASMTLPQASSPIPQPTVTKPAETSPRSVTKSNTAASSTTLPKQFTSLRPDVGSQKSSRSGSCYSSPGLSPTPSPTPSSSSVLSRPPDGDAPRKSSLSVKIIASDTMTWEIPVCRIEVSEGDSGTESESESEPHSDSVQELNPFPVNSSRIEDMERSRRVSAKEINDVLSQIRKATETKAKAVSIQPHVPMESVPTTLLETSITESQVVDQHSHQVKLTSLSENVDLPMPPESLPPEKQVEYLELRRKLAVHAKRKQQRKGTQELQQRVVGGGGTNEKGKGKTKKIDCTPSGSSPRATPAPVVPLSTRAVERTVPKSQQGGSVPATVHVPGKPSNKAKTRRSQVKKLSVEQVRATEREKQLQRERQRRDRAKQQQREMEEQSRRREIEEQLKRVMEYNQLITTARSSLECEQGKLTALTNHLTDCESEIEEYELKTELLRKQLRIAEENYDLGRERRAALQNMVRSVTEEISKQNVVIRETKLKLEFEQTASTKTAVSSADFSSSAPVAGSLVAAIAAPTATAAIEKPARPLPAPVYEAISDSEVQDMTGSENTVATSTEDSFIRMDKSTCLTVPGLGLRIEPVSDPEDTDSTFPSTLLADPSSGNEPETSLLLASAAESTQPKSLLPGGESSSSELRLESPTMTTESQSLWTSPLLSAVQVRQALDSDGEEEIDVVGSPEVPMEKVGERVTFEGTTLDRAGLGMQHADWAPPNVESSGVFSGSLANAFGLKVDSVCSLNPQAPSRIQLENLSAALSQLGQLASGDAGSLSSEMSEEVIGNAIDEALNQTMTGQQVSATSTFLESVRIDERLTASDERSEEQMPQTPSPKDASTMSSRVESISPPLRKSPVNVWKEHSYCNFEVTDQSFPGEQTGAKPKDLVETAGSMAELGETNAPVATCPTTNPNIQMSRVRSVPVEQVGSQLPRSSSLPKLKFHQYIPIDERRCSGELKDSAFRHSNSDGGEDLQRSNVKSHGARSRKCTKPKRLQKQSQSQPTNSSQVSPSTLAQTLHCALSTRLASLLSPGSTQRVISLLQASSSRGSGVPRHSYGRPVSTDSSWSHKCSAATVCSDRVFRPAAVLDAVSLALNLTHRAVVQGIGGSSVSPTSLSHDAPSPSTTSTGADLISQSFVAVGHSSAGASRTTVSTTMGYIGSGGKPPLTPETLTTSSVRRPISSIVALTPAGVQTSNLPIANFPRGVTCVQLGRAAQDLLIFPTAVQVPPASIASQLPVLNFGNLHTDLVPYSQATVFRAGTQPQVQSLPSSLPENAPLKLPPVVSAVGSAMQTAVRVTESDNVIFPRGRTVLKICPAANLHTEQEGQNKRGSVSVFPVGSKLSSQQPQTQTLPKMNATRLSEMTFPIDSPNAVCSVTTERSSYHVPTIVDCLPLEIYSCAINADALENLTKAHMQFRSKCDIQILPKPPSSQDPEGPSVSSLSRESSAAAIYSGGESTNSSVPQASPVTTSSSSHPMPVVSIQQSLTAVRAISGVDTVQSQPRTVALRTLVTPKTAATTAVAQSVVPPTRATQAPEELHKKRKRAEQREIQQLPTSKPVSAYCSPSVVSSSAARWKLKGFSAQVQNLQGELLRLEQRRTLKSLLPQAPTDTAAATGIPIVSAAGPIVAARCDVLETKSVESIKTCVITVEGRLPEECTDVRLIASESDPRVPVSEPGPLPKGKGVANHQSAGRSSLPLGPGTAGQRKRGTLGIPSSASLTKRGKLGDGSETAELVRGRRSHDAVLVSALNELGVKVSLEQLEHMYTSASVLDGKIPSEPVLALSTLGVEGMLRTMLPKSINFTLPEAVLSTVEKLEKQKEESSREQVFQSISKVDGYTPYKSPLLRFQSYRLSPFYRTHAKLPVSSLSTSHKINPFQIMCKYELHGICNDSKCSAQHLKDIGLSKQELMEDLVGYAPTIARCSQEDLQVVDRNTPELRHKLSTRIRSYASSMIQTYSGKITDEQLYILAVHQVNQERARQNTQVPRSFVSYQERCWLPSKDEEKEEWRRKRGNQETERVRDQGQRTGAETVEMGSGSGSQFSSVNALVTLSERQQASTLSPRYYSPHDAMTASQSTSEEKEEEEEEGSTTEDYLKRAQKSRECGKLQEAKCYLEAGLLMNKSSEELQVEWMRASSAELSSKVQSVQTYLQDLDRVCAAALNSNQGYTVIFECVRLARTYEAKQRYIAEGLKALSNQSRSEQTSHFCLELLLNSVQLDVLSGRQKQALKKLLSALLPTQDQPATIAFPLTCVLVERDLVFACLCCLHTEYCGVLPQAVFHPPYCHPPFRIVTKEPFAVPWQEGIQLSQEKYIKLKELFRGFMSLCSQRTPSQADSLPVTATRATLPLYQNLITFESIHGRGEAAGTKLLRELLSASPVLPEVWLVCATEEGRRGEGWREVVKRGVRLCHGFSSELYYFAARKELSQNCYRAPESLGRAVQWLERCVLQFFCMEPSTTLTPAQTLMLYRKLLGLLVPYDYSFPEFAKGVRPKHHLGDQLLPLWLCYCLLVEVTLPSMDPGGVHPSSMEDVFESAVHSVHDATAMRRLWMEYLSYLRAQVAVAGGATYQNFKTFSDCVQRCLIALETSHTYPFSLYGQPSQYEQYTFHNEAMELFVNCLPSASSYRLKVLRRFVEMFPRNTTGALWLVQTALEQAPSQVELAQDVLASFLAREPRSLLLWRLAISLESQQRHIREARWMYHQSVKALPFHAHLWKDFLQFEMCNSPSFPTVTEVLKMAHHVGIELACLFEERP